MKSLIALISVSFLLSCASSDSIIPSSYELPKYKEIHLDNGLRVLLLPDKKIPFVSLSLMIPTGFTNDPMTKSGLSSIVGAMLEKGSSKRSATKIADDLDFMGVEFGTSVGSEMTSISMDGMSKFEDEILASFEELIFQPKFPKKELKSLKKRMVAAIQKRKDQPSAMASIYGKRYLFGNHPFAKTGSGEVKDIKSIAQSDLKSFYKKYYVPEGAVLAVMGNYSPEFQAKLQNEFSQWKGKKPETLIYPSVKNSEKIQIRLVSKKSLKQAQVRMLHYGPGRKIEDYMALRIANAILGGSFSSRLMDEIRDNRGLTYGVYSNFGFGRGVGSFEISTFTRNEKVGELLETAINIYRKTVKEGVTDVEVERAKNSILGRFPRAVETPEKLAGNLLILRAYGISDSYLTDYIKNVNSVSTSDVNEAIKKYMKPESLKILVYSPEKGVKEQLQRISLLEVKKAY